MCSRKVQIYLNPVGTPLQVYGLDSQTDCMGHLTHADFDKQDDHPEHPKQYSPDEINAMLIRCTSHATEKTHIQCLLAKSLSSNFPLTDPCSTCLDMSYPERQAFPLVFGANLQQ